MEVGLKRYEQGYIEDDYFEVRSERGKRLHGMVGGDDSLKYE